MTKTCCLCRQEIDHDTDDWEVCWRPTCQAALARARQAAAQAAAETGRSGDDAFQAGFVFGWLREEAFLHWLEEADVPLVVEAATDVPA